MLARVIGSTQELALSDPVPPYAAVAAAVYAYRRRRHKTPDAIADPGHRRPPWSVAEALKTGQLPDAFVRALAAWFQSMRTHPGADVVYSSLERDDPSPTRP